MADSDYNVIKPVESLQTIQGLAPTERRRQRRRRQNAPTEHQEEPEAERQDADEPQAQNRGDSSHSVDYCA